MDDAFKRHDWPYQHGGNFDAADRELIRALKGIRPRTLYGKFYRLLAIAAFTAWPWIRLLLAGFLK